MLELLLLLVFSRTLLALLLYLLLSGLLDLFLELQASTLLLFKQLDGLLFGFSHLLIQDFILSVLHGAEHFSLAINESLTGLLLLSELLLLLILLELIKGSLLIAVLLNLYLVFSLLLLDFNSLSQ